MLCSRIAITLFSTLLGCRRSSEWAARAFGSGSLPLCPHRRSRSTIYGAPETTGDDEDEMNAVREELMDQSVLLYSKVSQRTKFGDQTEAELDVLHLRGRELTLLLEDAVFDSRGIVRGGGGGATAPSGNPAPEGTAGAETETTTTEEPPASFDELSRALDEQILSGYRSTFTDDELERWIEGIDGLQQKRQSVLTALPPAPESDAAASSTTTTTTEATTAAAPPLTPLDRLHGRLDSLRVLIDV